MQKESWGRKERNQNSTPKRNHSISISFCCVWATCVHFSLTLPPPFHSVLRPILNRYWAKHFGNKVSLSEHTSKTYLGNHALREKKETNLWSKYRMNIHHYHVSLPTIHVHTAVNTPPEVIFRLALPSKHRNSCRDGNKSADSSFWESATPIPISEIHVKRKRLQKLCWKGNNFQRAKSQNGTCSSETSNKFKRFLILKVFWNLKMLFSLANFILGAVT